MEAGTFEVGSIVLTEHRAAQREYRRRHWEKGPWETAPSHCDDSCSASGRWGATGIMPIGHFWYWRNEKHTSGYLAHSGTGSAEAGGSGAVCGSYGCDLPAGHN